VRVDELRLAVGVAQLCQTLGLKYTVLHLLRIRLALLDPAAGCLDHGSVVVQRPQHLVGLLAKRSLRGHAVVNLPPQ